MWWSWVGYAWLTSVVDPEEGIVRLAIFLAMAALLVIALCVPEAFDSRAGLFAAGYARGALRPDPAVRGGQPRRSRAAPVGRRAGCGHGRWRRPDRGGGVHRRGSAGGALVTRPPARHERSLPVRLRGLEARARPLRRAPRADHHHRPGRVDRGDRSRRRGGRRRRRGGGGGDRHGSRGRAVVALLRRRCPRRRSEAVQRRRRAGSRTRSRATRSPTCTSPWSPGSSCWRSG